jgi:hypothetical protein
MTRPQSRRRSARGKEWPDYYLTPTRDFTQFTRDYEEKYWSRDTAFDWGQDVEANLAANLSGPPEGEFLRIATFALALVADDLAEHAEDVGRQGLPLDEDALRAIAGSLPASRDAVREAMAAHAPLERLDLPVAELQDRLAILGRQLAEVQEERRLRLFRTEAGLKRIETDAERREQAGRLSEQLERVGVRMEGERLLEFLPRSRTGGNGRPEG